MAAEALLLSAVVFGPLAFGATERWSAAILEGMLFAVAVLGFSRKAHRWSRPLRDSLLPAVGLVLLIGIVQFLNPHSVSSPAGALPFTAARQATGWSLVLWASYAALILGGTDLLQSRDAVRRFLWTLFLLGGVIAVIGLMQTGQGNAAFYGLRPVKRGNPFGPYTNCDHAASLLVLALFAGGGLWLSRWGSIRGIEELGRRLEAWTIQLLIGFFLGIIFYAIVFIRSRGAIHSMALAAAFAATMALFGSKARWARIGGAAALFVAAGIYGAFMIKNGDMIGFEKSGPSSAMFRLELFKSGFGIVKDFPVFGTGLASYETVYPVYQDLQRVSGRFEHVHNDWLELLIQTGFVGLGAYVLSLFLAFRRAIGYWMESRSFQTRCLRGACLAAAVSFCVHGLVDFSFQIPANAVIFFILVICMASSFAVGIDPGMER